MRISDLISLHTKLIPSDTIYFSERIREFCKRPYPGHPNGCPNYNKNPYCPPKSPYRADILKKYSIFRLVWVSFDFETYMKRFRVKHPDWTLRQLANPLYWQNAVKRILKEYIKTFQYDELLGAGSGFLNAQSLESAGINVFVTLKRNKIPYEIRPKKQIIMVALLMSKKRYGERLLKHARRKGFISIGDFSNNDGAGNKFCLWCGKIITNRRHRYCSDDCFKKFYGEWYSLFSWDSIRDRIMEKDKYTCLKCGRRLNPFQLEVHHLIPKCRGGEDLDWNLVTLCKKCHNEETRKLLREMADERRKILPAGQKTLTTFMGVAK